MIKHTMGNNCLACTNPNMFACKATTDNKELNKFLDQHKVKVVRHKEKYNKKH